MRLLRGQQADEQADAGTTATGAGAVAAAGGRQVLQRPVAGSDSFHQRQNALVQRRAERAAQKQPDDEEELQECTCELPRGAQHMHACRCSMQMGHGCRHLLTACTWCTCYARCVCTVRPAINPASKVLHRGVEELHKWDARRRWHVSLAVLHQGCRSCECAHAWPQHPWPLHLLLLACCCDTGE